MISEKSFDNVPGKDKEEKELKLSGLVNFISSIIDVDLSYISSNGIIFQKDEQSARELLELIILLISILKQEDANINKTDENSLSEDESEDYKCSTTIFKKY